MMSIKSIKAFLIFFALMFGTSSMLFSQITYKGSDVSLEKTTDKILVAYASESGSTKEIADSIGSILSKNNTVDILRISEVPDLSSYKQVIIGAPIMYNMWMKEARDFIKYNEDVLAKKNVSCFLVCLVLCGNIEKSEKKANKYASEIEKIAPKIKVYSFGKFAGVLNYSKMSFKSKVLMKTLMLFKGLKEGDYRDWKHINEWTERLSL